MKRHLFIIIVLLSAATLFVFASCDNAATQVDRITLDASPGDFEEGDVSGTIPANEDEAMNALGESMGPAMLGIGEGFQPELGITCFETFFETFFESFIPEPQGGGFQPLDIVEDLTGWDDVNCEGVYKITGSETVIGEGGGTASLTMPSGGAVFEFRHGQPATWLRGAIDINTIDMEMVDYEAVLGDPIVNALGVVFTDVDVKVDLSNFDIVNDEPTGSITITYGAFDIQTEVIIAVAANAGTYGGIFWLDFKVWIPPQTVTINMDTLMSGAGESGPDPETIINAVAPGLSVYFAVKVYEDPTSKPKLDFQYTLDDITKEISN